MNNNEFYKAIYNENEQKLTFLGVLTLMELSIKLTNEVLKMAQEEYEKRKEIQK